MLPLNRALETLALTLPRADSLAHAATTLALVYQGDIESLPIRALRTAKLSSDELVKLVTLAIRDLQDWGRMILVERGLGDADDIVEPFAAAHAKIIQDAWDARGTAPTWVVFERQLAALRGQ